MSTLFRDLSVINELFVIYGSLFMAHGRNFIRTPIISSTFENVRVYKLFVKSGRF